MGGSVQKRNELNDVKKKQIYKHKPLKKWDIKSLKYAPC